MYTIFFNRTTLEFIEALTRSAHVDIKHRYINIRIFFADIHCVLGIIHAADFAAIAPAATADITRADAGNDDNPLRLLPCRRADEMPLCRPRCIRQTLQLQ